MIILLAVVIHYKCVLDITTVAIIIKVTSLNMFIYSLKDLRCNKKPGSPT